MTQALFAVRLVAMAFGIVGVIVTELMAIVLTVIYLMDKGWGLIFALIIEFSVIGAVFATLYAAFVDGYWWPMILALAGIPFMWVTAFAGGLDVDAA